MAQARPAPLKRAVVGVLAGAPGLVLAALYAARLAAVRLDPSLSPGTPDETVIALMVAGLAAASFMFSRAVFAGRVARSIGAIGAFAFAGVAAGLVFGVAVLT